MTSNMEQKYTLAFSPFPSFSSDADVPKIYTGDQNKLNKTKLSDKQVYLGRIAVSFFAQFAHDWSHLSLGYNESPVLDGLKSNH